MTTPTDPTPLTLEDVACVLGAGETEIPDETHQRLAPHIRADPRVAGHVRELERLAREAGTRPTMAWPPTACSSGCSRSTPGATRSR